MNSLICKIKVLILLFMSFEISLSQVQALDIKLVEAESFQFLGGWTITKGPDATVSGNYMLTVNYNAVPGEDAFTVIDNTNIENQYTVWVRTVDYPTLNPGRRLFKVHINDIPLNETGATGLAEYSWQKAGVAVLNNGENILRLQDTRGYYARCDAILFCDDANFDPNSQLLNNLQKHKITPVNKQVTNKNSLTDFNAREIASNAENIASIENEKIRLSFHSTSLGILNRTEVNINNKFIPVNSSLESNRLYLHKAREVKVGFTSLFPNWTGNGSNNGIEVGDKTYFVDTSNPFDAGELLLCNIISAAKTSESSITTVAKTKNNDTVTMSWSLSKQADYIDLKVEFTPSVTSYYSAVVEGMSPLNANDVSEVQLPPMFQYQRIPTEPLMVPNTLSPQPVSMIETSLATSIFSRKVTSFYVSAHPDDLNQDWGRPTTSKMGFSLLTAAKKLGVVAFSPVLGLADSKINAGETMVSNFILGVKQADWKKTLEYLSDSIYEVRDYRTQDSLSLTESIFNIIDLIKDDNASAWNVEQKGFHDIEANPASASMVVQPTPLAIISAAIMGKDEDLYIRRALPTIEFTLSRNGFRQIDYVDKNKNNYNLSPFGKEFNTPYFEGVHKLLKEANPWLIDVALPNNEIRVSWGYSIQIPEWVQQLGAYKLTGQNKWLSSAVSGAKQFLSDEIYSSKTTPLDKVPFYNTKFYPLWYDLVDLYEETKNNDFLDAAVHTAYQTMAGIRSYPKVKNQLKTIHPNNEYVTDNTIWWKGKDPFRLGFPRTAGDVTQKDVPESLVSPVGLGIEQPVTFYQTPLKQIYMSNWAPSLIRLYQNTDNNIFNIYARNGVIGRFRNYPGYYGMGYSDLITEEDYPFKGPDVSSIYFHHIPAHLSFSMDFLFAEAVQRSYGKVFFPWSKQEGFVWFNNRIYGGGKARIMDEDAEIWLKKGLINIDKPQVNYITAISENNFLVLLMNESDRIINTNITISDSVGIGNTSAQYYTSFKNETPAIANNQLVNQNVNISIAPKELSVLKIPLKVKRNFEAIQALDEGGMKVFDLGGIWGKLYVFRIRSPFGWDSLYGYITASPLVGVESISATLNTIINPTNIECKTKETYPYELSFIKLDPNQYYRLRLVFKSKNFSKPFEFNIEI